MSMKKIILFGAVFAFLAVSAATTFFVVAHNASALGAKTTTIHLAFTGDVTTGQAKGGAITGGLTEVVRSTGYFNGNLHLDDGTQISTSGKLDDGKITISFYNTTGVLVIEGIGRIEKAGDFVGTFKVLYSNSKSDSGVWSALPVTEPKEVVALAFNGVETKSGADLIGAIVLDKETLVGTFTLADGTLIPVSAKVLRHNYYNTRVSFNNGAIIGYGKNTENPLNYLNKGYAGPYTTKAIDAGGTWTAFTFGF